MQDYDGQFELNGQEYFYRAKDDSGSSKITMVNNEEHHYRMVEITNKETGDYDAMMISTGDSFTMFPNMVKNQYEKYLREHPKVCVNLQTDVR